MGRITRAKAVEMRVHQDAADIDINSSSSPHEANAGVGQAHLRDHEMMTQEEDPDIVTTTVEGPARRAATPVSDQMPKTSRRGSSATALSTPTTTRYGDPPGKDDTAEINVATTVSPHASSPYDTLEAAAIQAQTPPQTRRTTRSDDSITALDEMDEAIEMISAEVPDVQTSPQKAKTIKKAPLVRTTKASQARISLAHGPKDPSRRTSSWGKPPAQTAGQRVLSTSSIKSNNDEALPRKDIEIPHSKPRPMSMSFPPPRPPPKSTKVPTTSNFQLPGEAIAAKLKAAKESRLQKEAEEQKKKTFKARPAPSMTKAPAVRQTSTSKARESLMNGRPLTPPGAATNGAKRANSVAGSRPSTAFSRPASAKPKPISSGPRAAPTKPSSTTVENANRPSTAMASLTNKLHPASAIPPANPPPISSKPTATPTVRPASSMMTTTTISSSSNKPSKGREVFSRPAQAKAAAEHEKRQKEEAAKRARAEAAERTRQQSRQWAEKQRLRKLGVRSKENIEPQLDEQPAEIVAAAEAQ